MSRWAGKVALVTGASEGIGKAIARKLVEHGMKVVCCSRNLAKLERTASELKIPGPGEVLPIRCDVSKEQEVISMFQAIEKAYGALHVCVNNAGLAHDSPLLTGTVEAWNSMLSVNIIGLCVCTREAVRMMEKHGIDDGHIIHVNSMSGHRVLPNAAIHFYAGTKHAITGLAEGLRQELRQKKSHIRSTSISPGMVETDFNFKMSVSQTKNVEKLLSECEVLQSEDVADAVVYALDAPPRVNVNEIWLRPTEFEN